MAPLMMPAEPNPAMARPTINMSDETAAPHSTEPNSKMAKKVKKDHLFSSNLAQEPQYYSFYNKGRANLGVEVCVYFSRQWLRRGAVGRLSSITLHPGLYEIAYLPNWYALAYHPTSGSELKVSVMRGIALTQRSVGKL